MHKFASPAYRSRTIEFYLVRLFLSTLAVTLLFFILIFQIADIFSNIFKYMQNNVGLLSIMKTMYFYIPKCISNSLPIAILFSASFTLGTFYSNNELIIIYASGVSLISFLRPLLLICSFMSIFSLVFEDRVVIQATIKKKELSGALIDVKYSAINPTDVTILGKGKQFIWNVSMFDAAQNKLIGIVIIERDSNGKFISRINAQSGEWRGTYWHLRSVRKFFWINDNLSEAIYSELDDENLNESPDSFKGGGKPPEVLTLAEAGLNIRLLKSNGLPSSSTEAEYYKRFAFALTPFMVLMIAGVLAGKFKKNILLMSLLLSLVVATVYFVIQMISMILAKNDAIPPFLGGFLPIFIYSCIILFGFKFKRS